MDYRKVDLVLGINPTTHRYTIDTEGVVRNETNGKTLKGTSISKNNRYVKIHLDKFYSLARLVALHFHENPDNLPVVNHKDGDRSNNAACNVEWSTQSDNVLHAYSTKLKSNHGMKNPFRVLDEEDVRNIWSLRDTKLTARQIRDKLCLKVSVDTVKSIRRGKNWSEFTSTLD